MSQKMLKDIRTSPAMKKYFIGPFWIRPNAFGQVFLTIDHILPSIIILVVGLLISTTMFLFELGHQPYKRNSDINMIPPKSRITRKPFVRCSEITCGITQPSLHLLMD